MKPLFLEWSAITAVVGRVERSETRHLPYRSHHSGIVRSSTGLSITKTQFVGFPVGDLPARSDKRNGTASPDCGPHFPYERLPLDHGWIITLKIENVTFDFQGKDHLRRVRTDFFIPRPEPADFSKIGIRSSKYCLLFLRLNARKETLRDV